MALTGTYHWYQSHNNLSMQICDETLVRLKSECTKAIAIVQAAKRDVHALFTSLSRIKLIEDRIVIDESDNETRAQKEEGKLTPEMKPTNILGADKKAATMTDFGLGKLLEDDVEAQGIDLKSQDADTYWHLPSNYLEFRKIPLVSSKVEVWSAAVLLYKMVFRMRAFGHDRTQEQILSAHTIIKPRNLVFLPRPEPKPLDSYKPQSQHAEELPKFKHFLIQNLEDKVLLAGK